MEAALLLLASVAVVLLVTRRRGGEDEGAARAPRGPVRRGWERAVAALAERHRDVTFTPRSAASAASASGRQDGVDFALVVRVPEADEDAPYCRITVAAGLPEDLTIGDETFGASLGKALFGPDIQVGDPELDGALVLSGGDPAEVVAHLDADTRAALLVARRDFKAENTREGLVFDVRGEPDVGALERTLAAGLDVARAVKRIGGSDHWALERLAFEDPLPGVRARARALLSERLTRPKLKVVARRALTADDPEAATWAAEILETHAAGAVLQRLVSERADALSADALTRAIERLRELRRPPLPSALAALAEHPAPAVRRAAAEALAESRGPDVEAALIGLLASDDGAVVRVAAEGLGAHGTIASVEPLMARGDGLLVGPKIKRATREAVAAIQARATGGEGHLSLSRTDAGGDLTLATEAPEGEGRLALASVSAEEDSE